MSPQMSKLTFGILTVSDRCSKNKAVDKSGPNLEYKVKTSKCTEGSIVKELACVADEIQLIKDVLTRWSDEDIDVILTTGGTGLSPRDVTPEATQAVIEKPVPQMSFAMTSASLVHTPFAMLSRSVCGIRKKSLIINLPGSEKGSSECFDVVAPILKHAVALIKDNVQQVSLTHQNLALLVSKVNEGITKDRARESPWPMVSVKESQDLVMSNLSSLQKENVNLQDALGHILIHNMVAQDPVPPFPASIKDGYAVLSSDGSSKRKVIGAVAAGLPMGSIVVKNGECVRVNTGSAIPDGADSVIQVEDTQISEWDNQTNEELSITITTKPKPGLDIRKVGSDIAKGEIVLQKNSLLNAPELGLLATLGITTVPIYKRPRVSVISTGNELVEPSITELKPGNIRDSNRTTLISLLKQNGYSPLDMGISIDKPTELLRKLTMAMEYSDIIITTGSVSMGDKDFLKQVLITDLDATIHFGRVDMKPGKPTTFATCKGKDGRHKMIFCLPGNPVSATVTFHLYVLPALKHISGYTDPFPTTISVRVSEDVKLDSRPEYQRVTVDWNQPDGVPLARITGNQISSRLSSWYAANCLLVLPSSKVTPCITAGSLVNAIIVGKI